MNLLENAKEKISNYINNTSSLLVFPNEDWKELSVYKWNLITNVILTNKDLLTDEELKIFIMEYFNFLEKKILKVKNFSEKFLTELIKKYPYNIHNILDFYKGNISEKFLKENIDEFSLENLFILLKRHTLNEKMLDFIVKTALNKIENKFSYLVYKDEKEKSLFERIVKYQPVTENFLEKYKEKICLSKLENINNLSEKYLIENIDKFDWKKIFSNENNLKKLSVNFLEKLFDYAKSIKEEREKYEIFESLAGYQQLSYNYIIKVLEQFKDSAFFNSLLGRYYTKQEIENINDFIDKFLDEKTISVFLINFKKVKKVLEYVPEKKFLELIKKAPESTFHLKNIFISNYKDIMPKGIFRYFFKDIIKQHNKSVFSYFDIEFITINLNTIEDFEIFFEKERDLKFVEKDLKEVFYLKKNKKNLENVITNKKNWQNYLKNKILYYIEEKKYPEHIAKKMAVNDMITLIDKLSKIKGYKNIAKKINKNLGFLNNSGSVVKRND